MGIRTLAIICAIPVLSAISPSPNLPSSPSPNLLSSPAPQLPISPVLQLPISPVLQLLSSPPPQSSDTANLYRVNCQMCHGANGKALIPEMAFVNRPKWKHGTGSADMVKVITEGVKGTPMLPFKAKFTAAQIKALALYVRGFDKRLPPEK